MGLKASADEARYYETLPSATTTKNGSDGIDPAGELGNWESRSLAHGQ
jgi:hypothetical protein